MANSKEKQQDEKEQVMAKEIAKLPKDAQKKLKAIKSKLDKFKKKVLSKFDKYVIGISLLPPPKPQQTQVPGMPPKKQEEPNKDDKDKINVLVLVDDSDSKR